MKLLWESREKKMSRKQLDGVSMHRIEYENVQRLTTDGVDLEVMQNKDSKFIPEELVVVAIQFLPSYVAIADYYRHRFLQYNSYLAM